MDSDSNHQQHHQNQEEEEKVKINETVAQQQQDDEQEVDSRIKIEGKEGEIAIKTGEGEGEGEGGGDPVVPDHDVDIMIDIDGDDLIFSDNAFPSLPDFPCISSPSASSASNLRKNPSISASSSSSSSSSAWPFLVTSGQPQEPYMHGSDVMVPTPSEEATAETDIFGDIELWDPSNALDPSFLFPDDYDTAIQDPLPPHCDHSVNATVKEDDDDNNSNPSVELAKIFLDWLKSNRDSISPEDLRSIKLKKSTIECAATRLGGGKEGRTQLLKLILAWVQNHHLQKKKQRRHSHQEMETETGVQFYKNCGHQQSLSPPAYPHYQFPLLSDAGTNPNPNPNPNPSLDYSCEPTWTMHYPVDNPIPASALPCISEAQVYQSAPVAPYHYYQSASTSSIVVNSQPFSPSPDFGHVFSPPPMHFSPFAGGPGLHPIPQYPVGYNSQYSMYPSPTFTGAASATKEARKKRMARQRRVSALHQHRNHQNHNNQNSSLTSAAAAAVEKVNLRAVSEGGSSLSAQNSNNNSKSWAFWSSARQKSLPTDAPAGSASLPDKTSNMQQAQSQSRNASSSDKRQGLKSEKNLRFLLQKVLKQSDVGSLGRIVLPKKEAEIHLPELDARDGISIPMEDIGTSRVWNMKYRFWPNNKSRMYLLENTGDFVRSNGLQEGDFIVIYSDVKCNKYMIRGVKVRQQPEPKGAGGSKLDAAKAYLPKKNSSDLAQRSSSTSRTKAAACDDLETYENENHVVEHPCYSEEDGDDASP